MSEITRQQREELGRQLGWNPKDYWRLPDDGIIDGAFLKHEENRSRWIKQMEMERDKMRRHKSGNGD